MNIYNLMEFNNKMNKSFLPLSLDKMYKNSFNFILKEQIYKFKLKKLFFCILSCENTLYKLYSYFFNFFNYY